MKTTKEKIEVMQAFDRGETIEAKSYDVSEYMGYYKDWSKRVHGGEFSFNWYDYDYRIKPTQTLKERIEAEYKKFNVVMLEHDNCQILKLAGGILIRCVHTSAQSMKGFYKYVYEGYTKDLYLSISSVNTGQFDKTIQPVAVLFYKQEEEK